MLDFCIFTDKYTYQRNVNHVTNDLEQRLAGMYGASKVFLTNSCMEAVTTLFDYLLPVKGVVLVNRDTYYETRQWLDLAKRFHVVAVDFKDLRTVHWALLIEKPDVVYLDNPSFFFEFYDLKTIVEQAHGIGAKVIVDNTVLSLYYSNPIMQGADYAVESYSKYLAGHGDVMAGGIVCRDVPLDDMRIFIGRRGRCVSAMTVFLLERSLETLDVRMKKHTENGRNIYLRLQDAGIEALYSGFGGCIIFPGKDEQFCDRLAEYGHFRKAPTFGTTFSTTSFVRSPDLYRIKSYARISCGLEDPEVLWSDLANTLGLFFNGKEIL